MAEQAVYDFTNAEDGLQFPLYDEPLSICPLCQRIGQRYAGLGEDVFLHVISLTLEIDGSEHGPVWVLDRCELKDKRWVISEPAASLPERIKHPYEIKAPPSHRRLIDLSDSATEI